MTTTTPTATYLRCSNCFTDLTTPSTVERLYTNKDGGPDVIGIGHYEMPDEHFEPDSTPDLSQGRYDLGDDSDMCASCDQRLSGPHAIQHVVRQPKRLLAGANTIHPMADPAADLMVVTLTPALVERIKTLSSQAAALNVLAISDSALDFGCTWGMQCDDFNAESPEDQLAMIEGIQDDPVMVECPRLVVGKDKFHFSAIPKHGTAGHLLETPRIPLSYMDSPDDIIAVDHD